MQAIDGVALEGGGETCAESTFDPEKSPGRRAADILRSLIPTPASGGAAAGAQDRASTNKEAEHTDLIFAVRTAAASTRWIARRATAAAAVQRRHGHGDGGASRRSDAGHRRRLLRAYHLNKRKNLEHCILTLVVGTISGPRPPPPA